MTAELVPGGDVPTVRCPTCLDVFQWDGTSLFERSAQGHYTPISSPLPSDPVKREERLRDGYVRCPNPSKDFLDEHFLPIDYLRYRPPLVIGLVGATSAGKSTLLAVMVDEIDRAGLSQYGFTVRPLVRELHVVFRQTKLDQLLQSGKALGHTPLAAKEVEFVDAFLLIRDGLVQPVVFFDVAGEDLAKPGPATRFIQAVGALIFVVDPHRFQSADALDASHRPRGDAAFKAVLDNLIAPSGSPAQRLDLPAAIVLAKADTLRFEPPVARWLARGEERAAALDVDRIRAESRDVYAFLYQRNAEPWLEPFKRFRRCTLHVASATGSNPVGQVYRRGLRPRRVLEPLVAILAMCGVIADPRASEVGGA